MKARVFFSALLLLFIQGLLIAAYTDYDFGQYRYGGQPAYRYYDKFDTPDAGAAERYVGNENERVAGYWEDKYYGTVEPTATQQYEVNRELLDML